MTASHRAPLQGRTRWRRFGAMITLSTAASAGVLMLLSDGAIAAGFMVSGQQFKVSADKLEATGFVQYGTVAARGNILAQGAQKEPVAVSAMRTATLTNLCQSVYTPIVGGVVLRIEAGDPKRGGPASATNMTVDMERLEGDAVFKDIEIGRDAGTLTMGTADEAKYEWERKQRQKGFFAQQSSHLEITGLKQVAWATSAGEFKLKNLHLSLSKDRKNECFPGEVKPESEEDEE
ncbi:MAG TPA: DUF6230 family protein [Catenuloplanes sp.]|jgi:hypothetical protein